MEFPFPKLPTDLVGNLNGLFFFCSFTRRSDRRQLVVIVTWNLTCRVDRKRTVIPDSIFHEYIHTYMYMCMCVTRMRIILSHTRYSGAKGSHSVNDRSVHCARTTYHQFSLYASWITLVKTNSRRAACPHAFVRVPKEARLYELVDRVNRVSRAIVKMRKIVH